MQHELKILPQYLKEVWDMKKSFELRKNERNNIRIFRVDAR